MVRRVVRRLVPRSWPSRLAIGVAGVAVAIDAYLFADYAASCEAAAPDCEPYAPVDVFLELAVVGATVFLVVFVLAVLLRSLARLARRHRAHWRPAVAAALMVAMFAAGALTERTGLLGGPPSRAELGIVGEAWTLLHERYVRAAELDSTELAHAAIEAMTAAVGDTGHTSYYTTDEVAALEDELNPTAWTIGAEVEVVGEAAIVRSVTSGGPADRAGLRVGDRVLTVDGRSARGLAGTELAGVMGDGADGLVTMTVNRAGAAEPLSVEIECDEVPLSIVEWSMIPGRPVALVWIPEFAEGVADDLAGVLGEVAAADATGIVLDLRANPGGLADEAVATASAFLASGLAMRERDAGGTTSEVPVDGEPIDATTPLVVLVDGDTASSSEVVASALQVADRATLVGRTTFGTGTILEESPLADGSALWIGTTEWLTADGRSVWHTGVEPDVVVAILDGAEPVRPADLASLDGEGLRDSGDAQLLMALHVLEAAAP